MYTKIFLLVSESLIFLSILTISGVLADEQIIHGNLFVLGLLAILVAYTIPFSLVKHQKYIGLCIYGIFVSIIGLGIMYYDYSLIITRGFHAFGNPVIYILLITGLLLSSIALYLKYRISRSK